MPFQSNEVFIKASAKSPLGMWSVHWRCPWNPPAMALCPKDSSLNPISFNFGLPHIKSRNTINILTTYSQSASSSIRFFFFLGVLKSVPSLTLQYFSVHAIALVYSVLS